MGFKPTKSQEDAIYTNGNVLVSAAAGSGKTAVLVERVFRKLCDENNPVDADRLLIVTFTNDAAYEMRTRIEQRFAKELRIDPNNANLIKQSRLISCADICTIDSFCINLVRENFEKCGVEPDFSVGGYETVKPVYETVIRNILDEYLQQGNQDFEKLLEITRCEYDDENLKALILNIYNYIQNLPFPEMYIEKIRSPYEHKFCQGHIWYDYIFDVARGKIDIIGKALLKMAESVPLTGIYADKCANYSAALSLLVDEIKHSLESNDWDFFSKTIKESSPARLPKFTEKNDGVLSFCQAKNTVSDTIKELQGLFRQNAQSVDEENKRYMGAVNTLCDILLRFNNEVLNQLVSENTFTFSHIEQMVLRLLCEADGNGYRIKPEAEELAKRYDEVLVDEFQDVNDLQDMIFCILSDNEKNLFVVGDVKQSIYGFRGSNPKNFLDKKFRYIPLENAKEDDAKKIILSDNFRSRKDICDYVNFVFSKIMTFDTGGLDYGQEESLNGAAVFPNTQDNAVRFTVVDADAVTDDKTPPEVAAIADYIEEIMAEDNAVKKDDDTFRKASYGDFSILFSKTNEKVKAIAAGLEKRGIPVSVKTESFTDTFEISLILSLISIVNNPRNDVQMLCVMLSPLFGFTPDELAKMRIGCRNASIYGAVLADAERGSEKAKNFVDKLSVLRRYAAASTVDEFISYAVTLLDIQNTVCAMPMGADRRDNVFTLMHLAKGYSSSGSLAGFVEYIKSLPAKAFESQSGATDKVRIMTMHTSKGLQFPICILVDLSSPFGGREEGSYTRFGEGLGIGFSYYDYKGICKVDTFGREVIGIAHREREIKERMRLLYVAMTRAMDKLALFVSMKNIPKTLQKVQDSLLPDGVDADYIKNAKTLADFLIAPTLLHKSAKVLRARVENALTPAFSEYDIDVNIYNGVLNKKSTAKEEKEPVIAEETVSVIKRNIEYKYPYEELSHVVAKASVSEVANKAESIKFSFTNRPSFMLENGITAAGKGTAMHQVMQFIDFNAKADVDGEIERLVEWKYITEAQAKVIDKKAISRFFESDIFRRIITSRQVNREMRFLFDVPASKLDSSLSDAVKDTPVIIQGAVDLCFEENDGIVVLDFKTDRVTDESELISAYSAQLSIYADACEKIFSKKVKEKVIYSFELSKEIKL